MIIGGEKALPARVSAWQKHVGPRTRLINTYGPTEATVVAMMVDISTAPAEESAPGEVPIGSPIPNVQAYILDREMRHVASARSESSTSAERASPGDTSVI